MSTEALLELALNADLTDDAKLALRAELHSRKDELAEGHFEIVKPRKSDTPKWAFQLVFFLAMLLLSALYPVLLPIWRKIINW